LSGLVKLGVETERKKLIATDPLLLMLEILTGNGTFCFD